MKHLFNYFLLSKVVKKKEALNPFKPCTRVNE